MPVTKSLHVDVDEGGNFLLLSLGETSEDNQSCVDLLSLIDPGRANLLAVTYRSSPDAWFRRWVETIGERPDNIGVISVGETTRSTVGDQPGIGSVPHPGDFPISTVPTTALTELGIEINRFLADWENNSNQTVLCFDSVTAMLQWTELEPVFRFLHVLTNRLSSVHAIAHFHCDPRAHEETTVRTLEPLFDDVISPHDQANDGSDIIADLDRSSVAEALKSPRRRVVLEVLMETPGYVSIRDLADAVVQSTNQNSPRESIPATDRQRAMTQLHHTDLPKLAEAGLITYDSGDNVATLAIPAEQGQSMLDGNIDL